MLCFPCFIPFWRISWFQMKGAHQKSNNGHHSYNLVQLLCNVTGMLHTVLQNIDASIVPYNIVLISYLSVFQTDPIWYFIILVSLFYETLCIKNAANSVVRQAVRLIYVICGIFQNWTTTWCDHRCYPSLMIDSPTKIQDNFDSRLHPQRRNFFWKAALSLFMEIITL